MLPKQQIKISSLCLIAMVFICIAYGLLIFYLPKVAATYSETGTALSPALKFIINVGHMVDKADILILPALITSFFAALVWRIYSSIKLHRPSNKS